MASDGLQGLEAIFFAFNRGCVSLVRQNVLRLSAMLEGAGLLWGGLPTVGEPTGSPGGPEALPADGEGQESPSPGREPSTSRLEREG